MSRLYKTGLSRGGDANSVGSIVKGAIIGRIVGFLFLILILGLLAWGAYKLFRKYFPVLTPNSKSVGDSCIESLECIGYGLGKGEGQIECCGVPGDKHCTKSLQGALGVMFCPEDLHGGTKNIGDTCKESSECAGYALLKGEGQVECCGTDPNNKHCTKSVQGALGVMACPEDVINKLGTVPAGQSCKESYECVGYLLGKGAGNVDCCGPVGNKKCTPVVKDLLGTYVCPDIATGQKPVGATCKISNDCQGYKAGNGPACCGPEGHKTCTQKRKDWLGTWNCPEECVGTFGGKLGTCPAS